jgi:hypothetical protein
METAAGILSMATAMMPGRQACSLRGSSRFVRPAPRQPRPCHSWHLPGRGMKPNTPGWSMLTTGWYPPQASGLHDMEGKAGHQTNPDMPLRSYQARPRAIPGVPSFPRGPYPAIRGMAFHCDPRLPTELKHA